MTAHKKVCKVEGCGRVHRARGWCDTHYRRWKVHSELFPDIPVGTRGTSAVESPCDDCGYVAPSLRALAAHRGQAHRDRQDVFAGLGEPADGWQAKAACVGSALDLFFVEKNLVPTEAKEICGPCPVRTDCLSYAMDTYAEHGVWGGLSPQERRSLRRRTQAQARKVAA